MIGVADNKDWTPFRNLQTVIHVVIKQLSPGVPFRLIMQQNVGYLRQTKRAFVQLEFILISGRVFRCG